VRMIRQLLVGALLVLTVNAGLVAASSPAGADARYEGTVQMARTDSPGGGAEYGLITFAGTTVGQGGFVGVLQIALQGVDCFEEDGAIWCDTLSGTWSFTRADNSSLSGTMSSTGPVGTWPTYISMPEYFYLDVTKATGSYAGQSGHGSLYGDFLQGDHLGDGLPAFNGTLRLNLA